jgi:hypothetical protein
VNECKPLPLIPGRIEVETWVGNRHDQEFRVAGVPALKTVDPDAEKKIAHYVDPVTALLRVVGRCRLSP